MDSSQGSPSALAKFLSLERGNEVMIILNDLVACLYSSPGYDATSCFKLSSDNNNLNLGDAGNWLELAYRCTIPTAIILDLKDACTSKFLSEGVKGCMIAFSKGMLGRHVALNSALEEFIRTQIQNGEGSFNQGSSMTTNSKNNQGKYQKLNRTLLSELGKSWVGVLTTQPKSILLNSLPSKGLAIIPDSFELFGIKDW